MVGNTTIFDAPPPRYPDDSFSNGFLTHRIPSRDNVDDSSRASCVHKGKVARIDRLFRRPLLRVNIILISAEIWNGVERCGCGCTNWRNRNPHFQRSPVFPTLRFLGQAFEIPAFFQGSKTQYLNYSRRMLGYVCRGKDLAASDSPRRLFRIYAVSGFRIQN